MSTMETRNTEAVKVVCPSIDELSIIVNQVRCEECNLVFNNESRFRMHDLKVHKRKKLDKSIKENIWYHCPVKNCIYSPNNQRHFALFKYLKQHYLKVHAEKKFTCGKCAKNFSTNAAKEAHMRICGTDFVCECQKVFSSYEALLTHAKRHSHIFDEKYKSNRSKDNRLSGLNNLARVNADMSKITQIKQLNNLITVNILPKPTCNAAVQTEEPQVKKKLQNPKTKSFKNQICRQTQTSEALKEKQAKKSAETQTAKTIPRVIRVRQVGKRKKISIDKHSVIREDISIVEALSSEYLLPNSPLSLKHDIILQDLWEEKSSSGTQTSPEKNMFCDFEEYNSMQIAAYRGISRSDPMLTEETFRDKYSSIETQTEKAYCRSIFETDPLNSNNETQTTDNFTEAMEPLHIYSNTCTQTCDDILSPDLELSDIQTQTAWNHLDETTVSTETQTKALKCLSGCNDNSWFTTQTNHMETQTDFLHIFEDLV